MSDKAKEIIKDIENGILPELVPTDYHGEIFGLQPMIEDRCYEARVCQQRRQSQNLKQ